MDKFLFYREWSRILLEYEIEVMKSQNSNLAETIIKEKYRLLEILDKAYEQKNLTLLKRFFKDMNADIMELYSAPEREPVNTRLRAVCGEDLTKYDKKLANSVQRIVKRGKIRNDSEYEKVRTYIDSIEGCSEHDVLLPELYQLADEFESAVGDDPSLIGEEWK